MAAKIPMRDRPLAFLDTETTGLDSSVNGLLEVAVVRSVRSGYHNFVTEYSTLIKPGPYKVDPKAMEVNGISLEEAMEKGKDEAVVAKELAEFLRGCVIVGHNVKFDWAFISKMFERNNVVLSDVAYHMIDTVSLAWPLVLAQKIDGVKLDKVASYLKLSTPSRHRALGDARLTREVYEALTKKILRVNF